MTPDKKARALAFTFTAIWAAWADGTEDASDDALRLTAEAVRAMDLSQIDETLAAPLGYFTAAYLDDNNPKDLTYDEMLQAISLALTVRK
jgi:hypothetical protein